jgi:hypothetical protein
MGPASVDRAGEVRAGDLLIDIVSKRGSAGHPYVSSEALLRGPQASRNLADVTHFLCTVHGRHPHAIDHAGSQVIDNRAREWLERAIAAFAAERALLVRLVAAAGPVPGTPAAADSDMVVMAQCHAIEMLTRSERKGCAIGAAMALVLDWGVVREVLETAARRFGVEFEPYELDNRDEIRALADGIAVMPATQRAMLFGAEQISLQHHGLWDLMEARQESRKAI